MAELSSFFNSVNGDRKYNAEDYANYFNKFIGNGVFPNPSSNLQVVSNMDNTIKIRKGSAWINGYMYQNTTDLNKPIATADGSLNRIDRVVLRYDKLKRNITVEIKKGSPATNPKAPGITRGIDIYELVLADLRVDRGATTITQTNITDTRGNSDLCGFSSG